MPIRLYSGNCEPTIDELLNDEIADLLMARDGLKPSDILEVVKNARTALARQAEPSFEAA